MSDVREKWDHPRSRGVYSAPQGFLRGATGSSPLARGLLALLPVRESLLRIIPARAGFTGWSRLTCSCVRDHPRSRGVYGCAVYVMPVDAGSSPLARGLRIDAWSTGSVSRIIPARAGFTSRRSQTARSQPDHPRSRGVYSALRSIRGVTWGSSPLARGLRGAAEPGDGNDRIIPARAGFTRTVPLWTPTSADHPRSRGVYVLALSPAALASGSSPLARGLRRGDFPLDEVRGIIPARAGFTRRG